MSQTVLITGASGGLGLEFAKIFSREGYNLLIVARREGILYKLKSELESQYHNHIEVFACDLSKVDAAYEVFNYTQENLRGKSMDKMKKITVIFICLVAISLTACGKTETNYNISDSGSWKDGTYTETAKGKLCCHCNYFRWKNF